MVWAEYLLLLEAKYLMKVCSMKKIGKLSSKDMIKLSYGTKTYLFISVEKMWWAGYASSALRNCWM
jgi:hypothetical protein